MTKPSDDYYKNKMVGMVRFTDGYTTLHVGRKWSAKQITSCADKWCRNLPDGGATPELMEIYEFGDIGNPKRCFICQNGKWIETKPKPWPKEAIASYKQSIHDAVRRAAEQIETDG